MTKKKIIASGLKFRAYTIISQAVEEGAACGVNRAYKHSDTPDRDIIANAAYEGVMNRLTEILDFDV
jgi:hypothetical protein